ncbi:hypothetical protein SAMN05444006_101310 [Allgaiera indica]|uniref:Uncharacterized protein n=1 Tax=Allgaiera indica TaxID=765699 RepID=A0A1H2QY73_9RHOB|nr:hypothetical protein SAMN05444006_101310 [Allgaiera indica]
MRRCSLRHGSLPRRRRKQTRPSAHMTGKTWPRRASHRNGPVWPPRRAYGHPRRPGPASGPAKAAHRLGRSPTTPTIPCARSNRSSTFTGDEDSSHRPGRQPFPAARCGQECRSFASDEVGDIVAILNMASPDPPLGRNFPAPVAGPLLIGVRVGQAVKGPGQRLRHAVSCAVRRTSFLPSSSGPGHAARAARTEVIQRAIGQRQDKDHSHSRTARAVVQSGGPDRRRKLCLSGRAGPGPSVAPPSASGAGDSAVRDGARIPV